MKHTSVALFILFAGALALAVAQAPDKNKTSTPAPKAPATFRAAPVGNMKQMMLSILDPSANIIFDVQGKVPANDEGWRTVENACVAIGESAALVALPNRKREDGKTAPTGNADWIKFTQALVTAGRNCLKAVKTRNQDTISEYTNELSDSCSNCHNKYLASSAP